MDLTQSQSLHNWVEKMSSYFSVKERIHIWSSRLLMLVRYLNSQFCCFWHNKTPSLQKAAASGWRSDAEQCESSIFHLWSDDGELRCLWKFNIMQQPCKKVPTLSAHFLHIKTFTRCSSKEALERTPSVSSNNWLLWNPFGEKSAFSVLFVQADMRLLWSS